MSSTEIQELVKGLKAYKKEVTASKKASREFLVRVGIVTEKGNLKKPYKGLCIQ